MTRTERLLAAARGGGPKGRRALRRLLKAGARGAQDAVDAVWDLWLAGPDDEAWAALSTWRRPRSGGGPSLVALGMKAAAADVVAAARRTGHPVGDLARARIVDGPQDLVDAACEAALTDEVLAAFCAGHRLAPADPHRAAVFFLLTGQDERYRLADPDHSLLVLAYRGAREEERARIRQHAAGEPGVVRALAEMVRGDRSARLDTRYLVDALAARRDWPALWALARDLPAVDAARAVTRFDGWRPDGDDAALLDLLASADLGAVTASREVVGTPWTVRAQVPGTVAGLSVEPDAPRVAVGTGDEVEVITFAPDRPVRVARHTAANLRALLALRGDALVMAGRHQPPLPGEDGHLANGWLARAGGTGPRYRTPVRQIVWGFARTAEGFAALGADQDETVWLYLQEEGATGFRPRVVDVRARLGIVPPYPRRAWTMATNPATGRFALAGDGHLHLVRVAGTDLHPLAPGVPFRPGDASCLAFRGPGQVAGVDAERVLRTWRLTDGELRPVAERQLGQVAVPACPVFLPRAGVFAVIDAAGDTRRLRFLDVATLADAPVPDRLAGLSPTFLAKYGNRLAVGGDGWVTMTDLTMATGIAELAHRPLAATTPADVALVAAQLRRRTTDPRALPFLELLYACLVHRFAVDVAIGPAGPAHARGDDIALGGSA
ncbi:hypothetical protein [Actinophytocola sp. KF-1]